MISKVTSLSVQLNTCLTPSHQDMVRAIGRLEKTDWNLAAIERKIEDNPRVAVSGDAERVPKWNKQAYEEKVFQLEIKYKRVDIFELFIMLPSIVTVVCFGK